jgi:uncharacterized protein YqjF (DUF2071 family)
MRQYWRDLTFVHWAVEPSLVWHLLPPGVRPDVHEGRTYVGLVPFRVIETGPARGPAVPYLGRYVEMNMRLYSVDETGRRGVVFLSLDSERALVVPVARATFGVPYRWGRLWYAGSAVVGGFEHRYASRLRHPGARGVRSSLVVRAYEPIAPNPLEHFVSARWGLHVKHLGRTRYVPIQHEPWPLRRAEIVSMDVDRLLASVGLGSLAGREPDHVMFSDGVDAEFGVAVPSNRPR